MRLLHLALRRALRVRLWGMVLLPDLLMASPLFRRWTAAWLSVPFGLGRPPLVFLALARILSAPFLIAACYRGNGGPQQNGESGDHGDSLVMHIELLQYT